MAGLEHYRWLHRALARVTLPLRHVTGEVILEHPHAIVLNDVSYRAFVHGMQRGDGTWAGWLEFVSGTTRLRTDQETSQPNRDALAYWATGLEDVYLDGALNRAK